MTTNNTTTDATILDIEKEAIKARYKQGFENLKDADGKISSQKLSICLNHLLGRQKELREQPIKLFNRTPEEIKTRELEFAELDVIREQIAMVEAQRFKNMDIFKHVREQDAAAKAVKAPMAKPLIQPEPIAPRSLWQRAKDNFADTYNNASRGVVAASITGLFMAAGIGAVASGINSVHEVKPFSKLGNAISRLTQRTPSALERAVLEGINKSSAVTMPLDQDFAANNSLVPSHTSAAFESVSVPQEGSFLARSSQSSSLLSLKTFGFRSFSFK